MRRVRQSVGLWVASAVVGSGCVLTSHSATPADYADVDRVMRDFLVRENVPGGAWGIIVDGQLAHVGDHGLRDVATGAEVKSDSVFRIASMTKSFTAMAILQLRDAGRLSLDDAAEKYLPELRRWRERIGECVGVAPVLAGSGATWFVDGARANALGELVDEGARVVVARTVPMDVAAGRSDLPARG